MTMFETLFSLRYNNGGAIERKEFLTTDDELVQAFGATEIL